MCTVHDSLNFYDHWKSNVYMIRDIKLLVNKVNYSCMYNIVQFTYVT